MNRSRNKNFYYCLWILTSIRYGTTSPQLLQFYQLHQWCKQNSNDDPTRFPIGFSWQYTDWQQIELRAHQNRFIGDWTASDFARKHFLYKFPIQRIHSIHKIHRTHILKLHRIYPIAFEPKATNLSSNRESCSIVMGG